MLSKAIGIVSLILGTAVIASGAASLAQPATAGEIKVYASVAAQGDPAGAFSSKCARCHGEALQGGDASALIGPGNPVPTYKTGDALLRYVMESMPDDAPGSYSPEEYLAAVSHVLAQNGAAVPAEGLTAENAGSISIGP